MQRIAIICKTLLKGGAEKQALILAKSLPEMGVDVCLINWYQGKADPENLKFIENNSINYFPLKGGPVNKLIAINKIIREENIQILVSYLTLANLVAGLSKVLNRKIRTIGGIRNEKLPFYKFIMERFIHNHINDLTVFNNYSGREKFRKRGFKSEKVVVIQNAIEFESQPARSGKNNGIEIKIITVGRFVKQKDYSTALHSFKLLKEKFKSRKFKYLIIGYGPLENEIRSLAYELNIADELEILINPPDVPDILRGSDIFMSTSLFEGVSNAIMEAMVAGLPIVATEVGDNKFLIRNSYNGYLVPCKNTGLMVQKLGYLCESVEKRNDFGRKSRTIIEKDFSKTKLVDSYVSLFSRLENK
jgi:glycosyltransferase involved in cell wall biosynthesis